MNRILLASFAIMLIACQSNPKFEQITQPDAASLASVTTLSNSILDSLKAGSYFQFTDQEATLAMVEKLDEKKQKSTYEQISGKYGQYMSMTHANTWKPTDGTLYQIYRFKARFGTEKIWR